MDDATVGYICIVLLLFLGASIGRLLEIIFYEL